jgi:hypothetical protein
VTFPIAFAEAAGMRLQQQTHEHSNTEQVTDSNATWVMTLETNSPTFFLPEFFAGCPEGE